MRTAAFILISMACPVMAVAAGSLETIVLLHASSLIAAGQLLRSGRRSSPASHPASTHASGADATGAEASGGNASGADASRADATELDASGAEASGTHTEELEVPEHQSNRHWFQSEQFQSEQVIGVLSVLCLLVATGLLFALAGSTSLASIERTLRDSYQPERDELRVGEPSLLGIAAVVFWLVGCAPSAGLFPLHAVLQTGFERSLPVRAALVALLQRALGAIMIGKVAIVAMPGFESPVGVVCTVFGGISALGGAVLACRSESLRNLAGNFWLVWGGVVLVSLGAGVGQAVPGVSQADDVSPFFTGLDTALLAWIVSSIALLLLMATERWLSSGERRVDFEEDLTGLGTQHPAIAGAVSLTGLTLSGIPPAPGFWCLVLLAGTAFQPAMGPGQSPSPLPGMPVLLAMAAVMLSMAVLAGRYVRLLSLMFHHQPVRRIEVTGGLVTASIAAAVSALLLWIGVFPGRLLAFIHSLGL